MYDFDGLPTLSALREVMEYNDYELDVTYEDFWSCLSYMLNRVRQSIVQGRKNASRNSNKNSR
jgi:hypothetical protein